MQRLEMWQNWDFLLRWSDNIDKAIIILLLIPSRSLLRFAPIDITFVRSCAIFFVFTATFQVGPLEIFVSRFNMPDDIAEKGYDASADMWVSNDRWAMNWFIGFLCTVEVMSWVCFILSLNTLYTLCVPINREVEIKAGCGVRLRIIGITIETELKAVGSIKDDCLGKISD